MEWHARTMLATALFLGVTLSAQAALISRLDGQAIYDTDRDITWLADANLAASNSFGIAGIDANGGMDWNTANAWIAALNASNHLGVSDWRLPFTPEMDASCSEQYATTSGGEGCRGSELGHLYYDELGGQPYVGIDPEADNPFLNLEGGPFFWSTASTNDDSLAWYFSFGHGGQALIDMGHLDKHVWVVRDGDIGEVPVPAAGWLLGTALGVVGVLRRRQRAARLFA
ncbi:MAG: DUF1566 domain-containing protein [Gammaproteobacteria bacterium]|nr:DUF1566 domain-containing protein [Gammaproteobacteria bacterium]